MKIEFSYGKDFDSLMEDLHKHPHYSELATLDGIGKQTDMVQFSKEFFGKPKTVADVSVDSNANVEDSSVIAYEAEVPKPLFRINAYYVLYKYAKKLYGEKVAMSLVRGQFEKDYYIDGIGQPLENAINNATQSYMTQEIKNTILGIITYDYTQSD